MRQAILPLGGFRVLELGTGMCGLCGKLLADLGADVIRIEKPGGEASRRLGPFYHGLPDPEKSLYWFAYNLNKRSITLNIDTVDGKEIFKRLASGADFVVESFPPRVLAHKGLSYKVLAKLAPRIIVTSVTPYGQTGPYSDYRSCDLTLSAMGGFSYMLGYPDRPPLRISFPQSWLLAGVQAAMATMIAHYYRQISGRGQHVDVSAQSSVAWCIGSSVPYSLMTGRNRSRQGQAIDGMTNVRQRNVWPCKDGLVTFVIIGGGLGARSNRPTANWMDEEGMADDFLRNFNWEGYDMSKASQELHDRLESYFARFFLTHTKEELYREGCKRGTMIYPICSPRDISSSVQLGARQFWVEVEHGELREKITYPGAWFRATEFQPRVKRRPPLIGEHNIEIYQELGLSRNEILTLKQANVI